MSERRAKGCLIAAVVWCLIAVALGAAYRYLVHPHLSGRLKAVTGSTSQYRQEVVIAADSFSGYCVLRSEAVKQELKARQIKLTIQDDRADYAARLRALSEGKVQLAVFTIDSLITAGAKAGDYPASIVLVLDETKGGDAIVAYRNAVPSLQELNHPSARLVVIPGSPSEFLARVVLAHFNLANLPPQWAIEANGAAAVYQAFRNASPTDRRAYALWEPYVSRALENPAAHVLIDSSQLKGYILDVLVAQREFLRDHPDVVRMVVEAYSRAAYAHAQTADGLVKLVREDSAQAGGEALSEAQARKVVQGIQWKNTLENYAHFGLVKGAEQGGLPTLEDIIGNIVDVLRRTGALAFDPLAGNYHTLYYDRILEEMRAAKFHPGQGLNLLTGVDLPAGNAESVRSDRELPALTADQWAALRPVGELRLVPIVFGRASASLSLDSERELQELARRLRSFPQYYLKVVGHARAEGDPEANRALAQARAEAAAQSLIQQGVNARRIRTEAAPPVGAGGEAQAVSFFVGQVPY
jgi:outer membrane protein OmpA-like peptidoglycan-associated protein/ABC-type nitrate/sulfonate/bicarbonate transport system substrate-binding protein